MTQTLGLFSFPSRPSLYVIASIFMTLDAIYILTITFLSPVLCLYI